jgi:hypothetical protein
LGTVRCLGTFLADPLAVPSEAVSYAAEQLAITDPFCFRRYGERRPTQHEHARGIRRVYDYREYGQAADELRGFLVARAWRSSEGPSALFNQARWRPPCGVKGGEHSAWRDHHRSGAGTGQG